ncbi:hypothetical protein GGR50DRAFT_48294 [Xylaria sp. CBS 124048]|nr:hypothetical protein GGR50DRAFT_48294 [Xylaria sp. CBS 124048]
MIRFTTLCSIFITSLSYLQFSYNTSAAFARPVHLSIATLSLAGLALLFAARYIRALETRHGESHATKLGLVQRPKSWLCSRSCLRPSTFAYLIVCIVCRVFLNWIITRTIHCSWDGLYAFLPFFLAICHHPLSRGIYLPRHIDNSDDGPSARAPIVRFLIHSLLWGFAVTYLSLLAEEPTGVICPSEWYIGRFIPVAQLIVSFLDAVIISLIAARLRQTSRAEAGTAEFCSFLGSLACFSAGIIAFIAVWSFLEPVNAAGNLLLTRLEVQDMILDSTIAVIALISGISLLGNFHGNLVAALVPAGLAVLFLILSKALDGTLNFILSSPIAVATISAVFIGFGALLHHGRIIGMTAGAYHHRDNVPALAYYGICAVVALFLIYLHTSLAGSREVFDTSPRRAIATGRADSDEWMARAMTSISLKSAVDEYHHRYGMAPPPGFDKWYEFATSVNSTIIDTFDQIYTDLLPFWAIQPALLRNQTTYLLEHPSSSMGGLLIMNGQTSISPHIWGSHRWMLDVIEQMVKPFSQWLPDMQLAFNLDDECRISVPAADMNHFVHEAKAAQSRHKSKKTFVSSFSPSHSPSWNNDFMAADGSIWDRRPDSFHVWSKRPIFSEFISPTCPVDAPVNKARWWNCKARCRSCSAPHMENGFIGNWTLSADLCHQPDLAQLHGFLTSPAAMYASQSLLPVFSQGKVQAFADILYPSPWSFGDKAPYEEEKDMPWERKLNSLYWRGALSDGFAIYGSWQTSVRARFVHLASGVLQTIGGIASSSKMGPFFSRRRRLSDADISNIHLTTAPNNNDLLSSSTEPLAINVSFVGPFSRCEGWDCAAEHTEFYGSISTPPPSAHDFQENWHHKHLMDLDGAGFSGRFLPFVRSHSLPYRAALFRTWWEERIHPWRHYVPLDLRLGDLPRALKYFGGSAGQDDAKEIAEAGYVWAKKALRKEDMEVYMFRLLLEWGRLLDDRREELGFVIP